VQSGAKPPQNQGLTTRPFPSRQPRRRTATLWVQPDETAAPSQKNREPRLETPGCIHLPHLTRREMQDEITSCRPCRGRDHGHHPLVLSSP
jgi:hypothetical protein